MIRGFMPLLPGGRANGAVAFSRRKLPDGAPTERLAERLNREIREIQAALTPDLLTKGWRTKNQQASNPLTGHCYVAAETLFHRMGGRQAGWTSYLLTHKIWPERLDEGETHWFIRHESGLIGDPTAPQYGDQPIPYEKALKCGFLTRQPSKRTKTVLSRLSVIA